MHAHALRYLHGSYRSDDEIRADVAVVAWVADLNRRLPVGVDPETWPSCKLHRSTAWPGWWPSSCTWPPSSTRSWAPASGTTSCGPTPTRCGCACNGGRDPLDHYQRLVNFNFILNVKRAALLRDFDYLGVDDAGRAAFRRFRADLDELQKAMAKEDESTWRMSPRILEVSVNG